MTVKQAAERMGISTTLVYVLCREKLIAHSRHGRPGCRGSIRLSEEDIVAYLEATKVKPAPAPVILPRKKPSSGFRHINV